MGFGVEGSGLSVYNRVQGGAGSRSLGVWGVALGEELGCMRLIFGVAAMEGWFRV